MLESKHLARAAALAIGLTGAHAAGAEPVTYTGSGNYRSDQDLMPLASGDAVVLGTAQGIAAISTTPPSIVELRCSGMGIAKAQGEVGSVFYCTFADPSNSMDAFDVKGIERGDSSSLEVVGGSGRWAGASGTGSLIRVQEWSDGGSFEIELTIDTP